MIKGYFGRVGTGIVGLAMGLVFMITPIDTRAQGVAALEENCRHRQASRKEPAGSTGRYHGAHCRRP